MPDTLTFTLNGSQVEVPAGITIAVAIAMLRQACRTSVSGQPRGPLCAMGICYECRVTIDGVPDRLACQTVCMQGMDVTTHA